jgi:hypothetical protein
MFRGRKDELSLRYTKFYWQVLQFDDRTTSEIILEKRNIFNSVLHRIKKRQRDSGSRKENITNREFAENFGLKINIEKEYKLNPKDIKMIHGLLDSQIRLFELQKANIFDYLLTLICQNKLIEAYKALIKIPYVGDKLASLTLRDVIFLAKKDYQITLKPYDYLILFPVDTWVNQVGKLILGNDANSYDNHLLLKIELISLCEMAGFTEKDPLSPLKLNAGIWQRYFNSSQKS